MWSSRRTARPPRRCLPARLTKRSTCPGTWSLASWVSSGFTVTMDGKAVDFVNDATTGMPTATVNFQDYLAQWAQDHPNVKVDGLRTRQVRTARQRRGSTTAILERNVYGRHRVNVHKHVRHQQHLFRNRHLYPSRNPQRVREPPVNATGTANSTGSTGANTSSNTGTSTSITYQ